MAPALQELNQRLAVVRDRIVAVARAALQRVLLIWPGRDFQDIYGQATLEEIRLPYCYHSGHLTPLGLFELLARAA